MPSAATTETISSLTPVTRSVLPVITTKASGSVVTAVTSTSVVKGGTSIEPPFSTSLPFTWKELSDVSVFGSRMRLKKTVVLVSASAAVTTTMSWFSPTERFVLPDTS